MGVTDGNYATKQQISDYNTPTLRPPMNTTLVSTSSSGRRQTKGSKEKKEKGKKESGLEKFEPPPPPVSTPGRWLLREEYTGPPKSFGAFICRRCSKSWVSAHSWKEHRQKCKRCNKGYFPTYLWLNQDRKKEDKEDKEDSIARSTQKPHDTKRCEACTKLGGDCTLYGKY
jgi:hypothetical protein